jgi:hypothetical protein
MPRPTTSPAALLFAAAPMLTLALVVLAASAQATSAQEIEAQARLIKQQQRRMLMAGPLRHLKADREYARAVKQSLKKHQPLPVRGASLKKAPTDVENAPASLGRLPRSSAGQAAVVPTNVLCNNPTGDAAGSGQSEQSIASWGPYVLVAWNDGQGFVVGPDTQGYGYSLDGGAVFTDGGMVPKTNPSGTWTSDPIVTVNEKTGDFWYCGLYDPDASNSGVAVIKATFSGAGISWGTVGVAQALSNTSFFIDKQWMVADSSTGNLYLTYTKFTAFDDSIMFQRSTNGGATWSVPRAISNPATAGYQQGSRSVVGPNGELYVIWSEIGAVDADYFFLRKSTDGGVTFSPEVQVSSRYDNFGTGAPGFNRERSVDFPAIAVDRTHGPNRGRVYVTWHESVNWYDDALGGAGNKNEIEPNSTYTTATPFTPGQNLRGAFANTTDMDWFSWSATQGTSYIFWVDSIPRPLYSARIYCTDGATRLAYAGELYTSGGNSFMVFTAPTTATYFLRMYYVAGGTGTGGYRVRTGVDAPGVEIGRDQRDVILTCSDNGSSWATPRRVNDDVARFDDWLPEVAVGADGVPYVIWFDWRDATTNCGGSSHLYASRSSDGGTTWEASQRFTSVTTPWTLVNSNIAPNQGDYNAIYADDRYVRPAWSDGRGGTPDVYTTAIDTWFTVSGCAPDTSLNPLDALGMTLGVTNNNPLFGNDYTYQLTNDRGWSLGAPAPLTVAASASNTAPVTLTVPDTAAAGVTQVCLTVANAKGTITRSCCFNLTVLAGAGVEGGALRFALGQNAPNPMRGQPTRIDFALPRSGAARLEVFSVSGQRVRTLVDGERSAGPNTALWDGCDERGNPVRAGTYYYRLSAFGQTAVRRLVVLK